MAAVEIQSSTTAFTEGTSFEMQPVEIEEVQEAKEEEEDETADIVSPEGTVEYPRRPKEESKEAMVVAPLPAEDQEPKADDLAVTHETEEVAAAAAEMKARPEEEEAAGEEDLQPPQEEVVAAADEAPSGGDIPPGETAEEAPALPEAEESGPFPDELATVEEEEEKEKEKSGCSLG